MHGKILVIAGSDSGGGAGIQADIKTIFRHNCFPLTVITAVTAQNSTSVLAINPVEETVFTSQLDAINIDINYDLVKIGMLAEPGFCKIIYEKIIRTKNTPIILDPVLSSSTNNNLSNNSRLLVKEIKEFLLPNLFLITANKHEAEILTDIEITNFSTMLKSAQKLKSYGTKNILIKGGHLYNSQIVTDLFISEENEVISFESPRIIEPDSKEIRGTGCSLASAIASNFLEYHDLFTSIKLARSFVINALKNPLKIGNNYKYLNHFS